MTDYEYTAMGEVASSQGTIWGSGSNNNQRKKPLSK